MHQYPLALPSGVGSRPGLVLRGGTRFHFFYIYYSVGIPFGLSIYIPFCCAKYMDIKKQPLERITLRDLLSINEARSRSGYPPQKEATSPQSDSKNPETQ